MPDGTEAIAPPALHHPSSAKLAPKFAWWCPTCQRVAMFGFDELTRYARDGWPVCCGETVLGYSLASVMRETHGEGD